MAPEATYLSWGKQTFKYNLYAWVLFAKIWAWQLYQNRIQLTFCLWNMLAFAILWQFACFAFAFGQQNSEGSCRDFVVDQCEDEDVIFESTDLETVSNCQYYCDHIYKDDCKGFTFDTTERICTIINATASEETCNIHAGPNKPLLENCPIPMDPCDVGRSSIWFLE